MKRRIKMRRETRMAVRLRLGLALVLIGPALALADSAKSRSPFEVDAVTFKENGRFTAKIVDECRIEQELRDAVAESNVTARRERPRRSSSTSVEPRHVTLRIDKVTNMGSAGELGTELGVTATPAGRDTGQLFLCQASARRAFLRLSHCSRITYCAEKIAKDIATWVDKPAAQRIDQK